MKINVFGMGYVGCVSASCLANGGHEVTGIDIDKMKVKNINRGKSPIIEPHLEETIKRAIGLNKLRATEDHVRHADVSIVCVGTPSSENGSLELGYILRVIDQIGDYLKRTKSYHVVSIRSTVLPGTVEEVIIPLLERRATKRAGADFGVCMNPEFMREGTSLSDYYRPPFTVIGQLDQRSGDRVAQLYKEVEAPLIRTSIRVAETVKYVCNAFHALKICFANEIGNLCKKLNVDSHEVMDIFCRDAKLNLSSYYLKPGFAFGGSCLPKDLRALLYKVRESDLEAPVLDSILRSNERQIDVAYKLIKETGKKKIGIIGLSFKPNSDDLRESPIVELAERLIGKGYSVTIYDREVSLSKIIGSNKRYIQKVIPHISSLMKKTIEEVVNHSQVIVVAKNSGEVGNMIDKMKGNQKLLDLVRIEKDYIEANTQYEGICW
jgi:GDP-mannose 6-dehydrogenase